MLQRSSSGVRGEGEFPQGHLVAQGDIGAVGLVGGAPGMEEVGPGMPLATPQCPGPPPHPATESDLRWREFQL